MPKPKRMLSQSAFVNSLHCSKYFWIYQNAGERLAAAPMERAAAFSGEHAIESAARSLFPSAIAVDWKSGDAAAVARTAEMLVGRKPIFGAGFRRGAAIGRVPILKPAPGGRWDLIGIEGAAAVPDSRLQEMAFLKTVCDGSGIRVGRCFVMRVDADYVRGPKLDVRALFKRADVTLAILPLAAGLPGRIEKLMSVMSGKTPPPPELGHHCAACPVNVECWSFIPDRHVFLLHGQRSAAYDLMRKNILRLEDIPRDYPLTQKQCIQVECERARKAYRERPRIQAFLRQLRYPLHVLDLQVFRSAIPPYEGLRPYEEVAFQYSVHVIPSPGAAAVRHDRVSDGGADPGPEILAAIREDIGPAGSVLVYDAAPVLRALRASADRFVRHRAWLRSVFPRFVDLHAPFRDFHYYHRSQDGGTSLGRVAAAMRRGGKGTPEIPDGETAGLRFCEMVFSETPPGRIEPVLHALRAFGRRNCEDMVRILAELRRSSS